MIKVADMICARTDLGKLIPSTWLFTALVKTMIPSPSIIKVNRPQRSFRLVRLKLTDRQMLELTKTRRASDTPTTYHPM